MFLWPDYQHLSEAGACVYRVLGLAGRLVDLQQVLRFFHC